MKDWDSLPIDEKVTYIRNEGHELFKFIEGKFDEVDKRFDDVDRRLDGIDRRLDGIDRRLDSFEKSIQREFEKTNKALRTLSGRLMFSEQATFHIFSNVLPEDVKERLLAEAEASFQSLHENIDEDMFSGVVESHSMMRHHFTSTP